MPLASGLRLGPYEILELVGAGGMGEVYRARDPRLGRDVAVKVLPAEVGADPERLRRFEQEARAVAALNHPNILTVFDVGTHEGTPYVVMELLQGETLREMALRRVPTQRQVLAFAVQAAAGLEAAHAKGIVHRDVKPENVIVTVDGRVKVLDFGLAKAATRLTSESGEATEPSPTEAGQVVGTIGFMSPEQVRGLAIDARTDVFSFGVLLYELLSGKHPFRRETTVATLTAILEEEPAELSSLGRGIAPAVSGIVRRCLEKGREERYGSGRDVRVALEAVLAAPAGSAVLEEVEERSPYPGLSSFTEKDAGRFFGREAEIKALWHRLQSRKLLAVIGPSGTGKTSFVRAGVVPARDGAPRDGGERPGRLRREALAVAAPRGAPGGRPARGAVHVERYGDAGALRGPRRAALLGGGRPRAAVAAGRLPDPLLGARAAGAGLRVADPAARAHGGGAEAGDRGAGEGAGLPVRGRGPDRRHGGVGGGGAGGAAAAGVRGLAAVGGAGPGEEAADAGGVRGDRGCGRSAGAARRGDDGPHRRRAAGGGAGGLPEPGDGAGDAGGGGPR